MFRQPLLLFFGTIFFSPPDVATANNLNFSYDKFAIDFAACALLAMMLNVDMAKIKCELPLSPTK